MARINCRQTFKTHSENHMIGGKNRHVCMIDNSREKGIKEIDDDTAMVQKYNFAYKQYEDNFPVKIDKSTYGKIGDNWYRFDEKGNAFLIGVWDIDYTEAFIDVDDFVKRETIKKNTNTTSSLADIRFNYIPSPSTRKKTGVDDFSAIRSVYVVPGREEEFKQLLVDIYNAAFNDQDLAAHKPGTGISDLVTGAEDALTWQQGAAGEKKTADELDQVLENTHGYVLHSITPMEHHADIDHLLICTKGIFLIDSKTTQAPSVHIHDDRVDGVHNGSNIIKNNQEHAEELQKALYTVTKQRKIKVNDLISVWPVKPNAPVNRDDDSAAYYGADLRGYFDDLDDVLKPSCVDHLFEALRWQDSWTKAYIKVRKGLELEGYKDAKVYGEPRFKLYDDIDF